MQTHEQLDAEIKTRIPGQQRAQLQRIADARHLKLADIIREAAREKIANSAELLAPAKRKAA